MKNLILVFIFLLVYSCQEKTTETEATDDIFIPISIDTIKAKKFDFLEVVHSYPTKNKYESPFESSSFQAELDSLCKKIPNNWKLRDSLYYKTQINGIRKHLIIKHDSINSKQAIIYQGNMFETKCLGYWIALRNGTNDSWKHYFLGLVNNDFYNIKAKSELPLFFNDTIIQLEAALVRKIKPDILPQYELIEDSILLKLNLNKICLDTDGDGLTNLVEKEYLTNPKKPDTDGDGIIDFLDKNPRFKSEDNEFTTIINFLIDGKMKSSDSLFYLDFKSRNQFVKRNDGYKSVSMIVTNKERVKNINPINSTYIIVDENEYSRVRDKCVTLYVQFLKINHKTDKLFSVEFHEEISGLKYLVYRAKRGWFIKKEYSYII